MEHFLYHFDSYPLKQTLIKIPLTRLNDFTGLLIAGGKS